MRQASTSSIQEVHCTLDLQEAEILAGLLHAEGIPAWVANARQISLNWLYIPAFGGFPVQVPASAQEQAHAIVTAWRAGDYALPVAEVPVCVRCESDAQHADPLPSGLAIMLVVVLHWPLYWPKRRHRCDNCGMRWKSTKQAYAPLAAAAERHTSHD